VRNPSANLVKKVEKAWLFCAKDVKKATIPYNSGQKRGWIEDYLPRSHSN
jgi:hypothetical protein